MDHYDAVIIGHGQGGTSLAKTLAQPRWNNLFLALDEKA